MPDGPVAIRSVLFFESVRTLVIPFDRMRTDTCPDQCGALRSSYRCPPVRIVNERGHPRLGGRTLVDGVISEDECWCFLWKGADYIYTAYSEGQRINGEEDRRFPFRERDGATSDRKEGKIISSRSKSHLRYVDGGTNRNFVTDTLQSHRFANGKHSSYTAESKFPRTV